MSSYVANGGTHSRWGWSDPWRDPLLFKGRPSHRGALVYGASGSQGTSGIASRIDHDIDDIDADPGVNAVAFHEGAQFTIGDAGVLIRDDVPVRDLGSPCRFLLPAGPMLLTGGRSGAVLDALSGAPMGGHRSPLSSGATFVRDGALHAVIGTESGEALVLHPCADGRFAPAATLPLHSGCILGLAADDEHLFAACAGRVQLMRIADFRVEWVRSQAPTDTVIGCSAWAEGFVGVTRDRSLMLWRGDGTEEIYRVPLSHPITCIAACPDSGMLAIGSRAGQVAFFDLAARSWLMSARLAFNALTSVAAVPSQPRVFTIAGRDGSVQTLRVR